jgi:hypothetical protein
MVTTLTGWQHNINKYQTNSQQNNTRSAFSTLASKSTGDAQDKKLAVKKQC